MSERDHQDLTLYLAVKGAKDSGGSIDFEDDGTMIISSPDPASARQGGMGQPSA